MKIKAIYPIADWRKRLYCTTAASVLPEQGYHVTCVVRNSPRFDRDKFDYQNHLEVIEADLMDTQSLQHIPTNIDAVIT